MGRFCRGRQAGMLDVISALSNRDTMDESGWSTCGMPSLTGSSQAQAPSRPVHDTCFRPLDLPNHRRQGADRQGCWSEPSTFPQHIYWGAWSLGKSGDSTVLSLSTMPVWIRSTAQTGCTEPGRGRVPSSALIDRLSQAVLL